MERNFKDVIEEIKHTNINQDETRKYILQIMNVIQGALEQCNTEEERLEVLDEYLNEYKEELKFVGNVTQIFSKTLMYGTYKRILADSRGNKSNFNSIIREAKKREAEKSFEPLSVKVDPKESMISAIRYMIRNSKGINEKQIIEFVKQDRNRIANEVKIQMIEIIQASVRYLEEYGCVDEYIETSNKELDELGLKDLKYYKRNPIADEHYDESGKLIQDIEDIGIMDTFETENLEKLSVEDLEVMTAFWESKYFQERIEISKAMSVINTLDLWPDIIKCDENAIKGIEEERIESALKKDLALTYLCKSKSEITPKLRRQYKKFLDANNILSEVELDDEIKGIKPEISNLDRVARDIGTLECLIIYQLKTKDIKIKKWGTIEDEETKDGPGIVVAIENPSFRGPLIMEVPKNVLKEFLETENIELPKYEKELDEKYCDIMSKLYIPANKFFNTFVKESYKENPQSELLANLAGKKVREEKEER